MKVFFLLLALTLTLGFTSCTPEEMENDTQVEQATTPVSDSPSDEAGEEEELEPNK